MKFFKELRSGLTAYGEAHRVLFRYKLVGYLVIPGLISVAYAVLFFLFANNLAAKIEAEALTYPDWLSWLQNVTDWFVKSVFWVAMIWLFFTTYKYVIQILLSPLLVKLSETVEKRITGRKPPKVTFKDYIADIKRAIRLALRNLGIETVVVIALNFIPYFGWFLALGVSAFYMGFGYMDYTLERKRFDFDQSIAFMRKHRGMTLGLGTIAWAGMLVPFLGWIITPTYATTAATLEVMKITDGPIDYVDPDSAVSADPIAGDSGPDPFAEAATDSDDDSDSELEVI